MKNTFVEARMSTDAGARFLTCIQRLARFITGREPTLASLRSLTLCCLAVTGLCYLQIITTPLTGFDNYSYFLAKNGDRLFEVFRGTWIFALSNTLFPFLGKAPVVSSIGFLLITLLTCIVSISLWSRENEFAWPEYLAALLFMVFPYWVSQLYFPYYHFGYALSTFFCACAAALAWSSTSPGKLLLSVALFVTGTAFYQGAVGVAASLTAITALLEASRALMNGLSLRPVLARCLRTVLFLGAGAALYLALHKGILWLGGLDLWETKSYAVALDTDIASRLWTLRRAVTGSPFLLPAGIGMGLPLLAAGIVVWSFYAAIAKRKPAWLVIPVLLLLALFSPVVLILVQRHNLFPRSMGGAAFVWCGVFLLATGLARRKGKKLFAALAILLLVAFSVRINYAWDIQKLTNDADKITANLIWQRIVSLPGSADQPRPVPVSLIGCVPAESRPWTADYESMFGVSQLACFENSTLLAHAASLLRFVGAETRIIPNLPGDRERVAGRPVWPADGSVFRDHEGVAVWLGGPSAAAPPVEHSGLKALAEAFGIREMEAASVASPPAPRPSDGWLVRLAGSGPGPWTAPPGLLAARGGLETVTDVKGSDRFVRVEGWCFDLLHKTVPDRVILADDEGNIIGFGASGVPRPDLSDKIGPDSYYSGFVGYMLKYAKPASFLYVSDYRL